MELHDRCIFVVHTSLQSGMSVTPPKKVGLVSQPLREEQGINHQLLVTAR